jgi:nucleoside-diphosphate-sugar epimerase
MSLDAYRTANNPHKGCVVVGLGLIGHAVSAYMGQFGPKLNDFTPELVTWQDSETIIKLIRLLPLDPSERLELIWCAGRAGFSSSHEELQLEYQIFREVLEQLSKEYKDIAVSLISSAGGIYEGSGGANTPHDPISPLRPYADWKLMQETLVENTVNIARIYRMSSVYGMTPKTTRRGLVNALIESSYESEPAIIYAKASTLRDYIGNIDVAKHIISRLDVESSLVDIVASGRPTSIDMLINMLARITQRKIKVSYRSSLENDKDIIFSRESLPKSFRCQSLEERVLGMVANYKVMKFGSN